MIDRLVKNTKREISIDYIQKVVCDYFNMSPELINSKTRKREIVQARQIAMFFAKSLTKSSLATIGSNIGGKDHATVLHACRKIKSLKEETHDINEDYTHGDLRLLLQPADEVEVLENGPVVKSAQLIEDFAPHELRLIA